MQIRWPKNSTTGYDVSAHPSVSIIIANYNNAKYLDDCLHSVIEQSCRNLEIVMVDDYSSDHSSQIIEKFRQKYPDVISPLLLTKNNGVARARHAGILRARGEYISTLDADDYYVDVRKIEAEMQLIREHKVKTEKNVIAFSNVIHETTDGQRTVQGNGQNIFQGSILTNIFGRSCMIPMNFTFLKSLYFAVGGYDFELALYEDFDLKIRLAAGYEYYFTGVAGTVYRRHGKGLSSAPSSLHAQCLRQVFEKNCGLLTADEKVMIKKQLDLYIDAINRAEEQRGKRS